MIDRSKLSPDGEKSMAEIEAQLGALCEMLTASVLRFRRQSRREQRRARKARKNLVMYKTAGRRPWNWWQDTCNRTGDFLDIPTNILASPARMTHLRERSGFNKLNQWIAMRWPK